MHVLFIHCNNDCACKYVHVYSAYACMLRYVELFIVCAYACMLLCNYSLCVHVFVCHRVCAAWLQVSEALLLEGDEETMEERERGELNEQV